MNIDINKELGNKFTSFWNISCPGVSTTISSKQFDSLKSCHFISIFNFWSSIPTREKRNTQIPKWSVNNEYIYSANLGEYLNARKQPKLDLSITAQTRQIIEKALAQYHLINYKMLISFLIQRYDLIEIIDEIPEQLLKYFFKDDVLTLELFIDPDEPDAKYLRLKIITKNDVSDAFDRLGDFEANWLFNKIEPYNTNLIFDIGYR